MFLKLSPKLTQIVVQEVPRRMFRCAMFEKLVEMLQSALRKIELEFTFICITDNLINRK